MDVPALTGRVNDQAQLFTSAEHQHFEQRLAAFERKSGKQFVVLTVPSLHGDPIEDFSIRVVEAWKLGKGKVDNGLLLLVVPEDRSIRIEVGYGLEDKITDALSSRIITQLMRPAFRSQRYGAGVDAAITALMAAASGDEDETASLPHEGPMPHGLIFWLILLGIIFGPSVLLPMLFGAGIGRGPRGGGGFGGGGFGGGGFGGGSGGGFSGGGGSFGGGGASGGW